jgi:nucleotide-binding universal stress UspA family protein
MTSTPDNIERSHRIVVGIDGSDSSRAALAWAARQAALTSAPLTVIITWHYPTDYGYPVMWLEDMDFAADAKSLLGESVSEVLGSHPKIAVTPEVVEGHPALVLVDESKDAALLVVGSRGHGEFTGMLLGSVSEFVSTHAHCPVVIIRGTIENADAPESAPS